MPTLQYDRPQKASNSSLGPTTLEIFDDFIQLWPLTSFVPVTASSPYNSAQAIGANSGTFSQATQTDPQGTAIISGAATTDKSGVQIQWNVAPVQLVQANGVYEYACRVKFSTASASDFFFGLATQNGTTHSILTGTRTSGAVLSNLDTTDYPDLVGIYKACNNAQAPGTLFYGVEGATGATATATPGFGVATTSYTVLMFQVLMNSSGVGGVINFYQDGSLLQSITAAALSTAALAPIIAAASGSTAGTQTTSIDFHQFEGTR
jgi:hypothetical protein